jgi:D-amino peptidase
LTTPKQTTMKVYITCDIEGCSGVSHWEDCSAAYPDYNAAREQMTFEAAGACRGALAAGAKDILVRDAHGSTRNLIHRLLPPQARLLRGSSGDLIPMITGLQDENFAALMMVGYHSAAGETSNPLSHTFNRTTEKILLNDEPMSEFLYYAYAAATIKVPQVLISGDQGICDFAKSKIPGITTVPVKSGTGASTISIHPEVAVARIEEAAKNALAGDFSKCSIKLPKEFSIQIRYREHSMALDKSFYPGVRQIDAKTLQLDSRDFTDILRLVHFVL